MRPITFAAALLVAVGASGVLAAQAQADPAADQTFLAAIKGQHVPVASDASAIALAHSTCDVLAQTGSLASALHHVKDETAWTDARDVGAFSSFAVQNYCPSLMPQQQ
jgi:hypothetical protein